MRKTILTLTLALSSALAAGCGGADDLAADNNRAAANANARTPANNTRASNAQAANGASQTPADGHAHGDTVGVRRITIEEARAAAEAGKAVFLDVRSPDAYRLGHIKGALSVPEGTVAARASELPKDKLIITYCA